MVRYFLFLGLVVLALGCNTNDDTDEGKVDPPVLNFTAQFNSDPLVILDESYPYEAGMDLRLQLFQFFISNVRLINDEGNDTDPILDVALVNFANSTTREAALNGVDIALSNIPEGTYRGIKFGIGVDANLNATQPGDYTPGHPLAADYWSAASSYIFSKVEGNADLDGSGDFSTKLTFHIGGNPRYREVVFTKDIVVDPEGALPVEFLVDLKEVLVDETGNFVDFRDVTQIHNGTAETAVFMMDNLSGALKLK